MNMGSVKHLIGLPTCTKASGLETDVMARVPCIGTSSRRSTQANGPMVFRYGAGMVQVWYRYGTGMGGTGIVFRYGMVQIHTGMVFRYGMEAREGEGLLSSILLCYVYVFLHSTVTGSIFGSQM